MDYVKIMMSKGLFGLMLVGLVFSLGVEDILPGKKAGSDECVCACERDAVLLHNIKNITFHKGEFTNSRRVKAIPQMECIGGSAMGHSEPHSITCHNVGNNEPHWRCETIFADDVQLGKVSVVCEGYEGPHDPYVLKGSCGLMYTMEYSNFFPYIFGCLGRLFTILVITPFKWLLSLALFGLLLFTIVAVIRKPYTSKHPRPSGISPKRSVSKKSVKAQQYSSDEDDYESEEDDDDEVDTSVWENASLRPRGGLKEKVPTPTKSPKRAASRS